MKLSLTIARLCAFAALTTGAFCASNLFAQSVEPEKAVALPEGFADDLATNAVQDQRVRQYLYAKRIVAVSETGVKNPEFLLKPVLGHTSTSIMGDENQACVLSKGGYVLLDFGCEIHGSFRVEAREAAGAEELKPYLKAVADTQSLDELEAQHVVQERYHVPGRGTLAEDLLQVPGIGEKTLEAIKDYILIGGINEDTGRG